VLRREEGADVKQRRFVDGRLVDPTRSAALGGPRGAHAQEPPPRAPHFFLKGKGSELPLLSHFKESRKVARRGYIYLGGDFLIFKKVAR
jgi:hypothetical protein